jgi:hypothetical protein
MSAWGFFQRPFMAIVFELPWLGPLALLPNKSAIKNEINDKDKGGR